MNGTGVNATLEYLKIGFAFSGALLGAIIGTPPVEWFKDRLGAQRQWKTQRNEIVATIRLIFGMLQAFREIQIDAFGLVDDTDLNCEQYSPSSFARLAKFDFKLLTDCLLKLSALQPKEQPGPQLLSA
jgi:hypothetical protein